MTVVLRDVDVTKRSKNDYVTNADTLLTLHEYLEVAKRCIGAFDPSSNMLRDDDAIAHVAEHLMLGHLRWKENGGRTLHSYLNQCAIWSIKSWKSKLYQTNQRQELSLNMPSGSGGSSRTFDGHDAELYQLVPDKRAKEPFDILFNDDEKTAQALTESDCLTRLQRYCLKRRYVESQTLQEIADSLSISRQAVHLHVKKAIIRLQNEFAS